LAILFQSWHTKNGFPDAAALLADAVGEVRGMIVKLPISAGLKGRFMLWAKSARGLRPLADWSDNLVLDAGLNRIGTGSWLTHCYVGSGSSTPTVGQTTLESQTASTATIDSQVAGANGGEPYYGYRRVLFNFAEGSAAGNLSEVGVGWSAGLFARALIVDPLGVPTTVTVLSDEVLLVLYEIQLYPPIEDLEFSAPLNGVSRTWTRRAASVISGSATSGWGVSGLQILVSNLVAYNGALGLITQDPSGLTAAATTTATAAYSNNSYKVGMSGFWSSSAGNLAGGLSSFVLRTNGLGAYQFNIDPPIAKTAIATLTLSFETAWSRRS
jgi:hypothetical protein